VREEVEGIGGGRMYLNWVQLVLWKGKKKKIQEGKRKRGTVERKRKKGREGTLGTKEGDQGKLGLQGGEKGSDQGRRGVGRDLISSP